MGKSFLFGEAFHQYTDDGGCIAAPEENIQHPRAAFHQVQFILRPCGKAEHQRDETDKEASQRNPPQTADPRRRRRRFRLGFFKINGADVDFSAEYPTTILYHKDVRGIIAKYSELFARYGVNIAFMRVYRHKIGSDAITVIESDHSISEELLEKIRNLENVDGAVYLPAVK